MTQAPAHLFVYGTLRRALAGGPFRLLARYGAYLGEGWIQGRLYEVDGYPGAVMSRRADDRVHGELYHLPAPDRVLAELDRYEECSSEFPPPQEYVRQPMPVMLDDTRTVRAWVYVYNRTATGLRRIESGDYRQFRRAKAG